MATTGSKARKMETATESATVTPPLLTRDDVICPICLNVMVEPVTTPCKHSMCFECFERNMEETSIHCPMCRLRLSSWSRKARSQKRLINQEMWTWIQRNCAEEVEAQLTGHNSVHFKVKAVHQLCAPGEILKEFQSQLAKLHEIGNGNGEDFLDGVFDEEIGEKPRTSRPSSAGSAASPYNSSSSDPTSSLCETPVRISAVEEAPVRASIVNEHPVRTSIVGETSITTSVVEEAPVTASIVTKSPVRTSVLIESSEITSIVNEIPVRISRDDEPLVSTSAVDETYVATSVVDETPVTISRVGETSTTISVDGTISIVDETPESIPLEVAPAGTVSRIEETEVEVTEVEVSLEVENRFILCLETLPELTHLSESDFGVEVEPALPPLPVVVLNRLPACHLSAQSFTSTTPNLSTSGLTSPVEIPPQVTQSEATPKPDTPPPDTLDIGSRLLCPELVTLSPTSSPSPQEQEQDPLSDRQPFLNANFNFDNVSPSEMEVTTQNLPNENQPLQPEIPFSKPKSKPRKKKRKRETGANVPQSAKTLDKDLRLCLRLQKEMNKANYVERKYVTRSAMNLREVDVAHLTSDDPAPRKKSRQGGDRKVEVEAPKGTFTNSPTNQHSPRRQDETPLEAAPCIVQVEDVNYGLEQEPDSLPIVKNVGCQTPFLSPPLDNQESISRSSIAAEELNPSITVPTTSESVHCPEVSSTPSLCSNGSAPVFENPPSPTSQSTDSAPAFENPPSPNSNSPDSAPVFENPSSPTPSSSSSVVVVPSSPHEFYGPPSPGSWRIKRTQLRRYIRTNRRKKRNEKWPVGINPGLPYIPPADSQNWNVDEVDVIKKNGFVTVNKGSHPAAVHHQAQTSELPPPPPPPPPSHRPGYVGIPYDNSRRGSNIDPNQEVTPRGCAVGHGINPDQGLLMTRARGPARPLSWIPTDFIPRHMAPPLRATMGYPGNFRGPPPRMDFQRFRFLPPPPPPPQYFEPPRPRTQIYRYCRLCSCLESVFEPCNKGKYTPW